MKITIGVDETELKAVVTKYLINRFKINSKYIMENVVNGIVEKKFFNDNELKKFIEDGVIAYLEKYPIKQIVKEVILKKKVKMMRLGFVSGVCDKCEKTNLCYLVKVERKKNRRKYCKECYRKLNG